MWRVTSGRSRRRRGEAWLSGRLGEPQVAQFGKLHSNRRVRDQLATVAPLLLERAEQLPHRDFVACARRFVQLADLDGDLDRSSTPSARRNPGCVGRARSSCGRRLGRCRDRSAETTTAVHRRRPRRRHAVGPSLRAPRLRPARRVVRSRPRGRVGGRWSHRSGQCRIRCGHHNVLKTKRRWSTKRDVRGRQHTIRADRTVIIPVGARQPTFPDDDPDEHTPDEIARLEQIIRNRVRALRAA